MAEGLKKRGVKLVTDGTDNHLVLLDVTTSFGLTGRQAESALLDSGVVTNRNSIPRDPNGAWYTSGVRIGTPALTSRGFGADEFDAVAGLMVDVPSNGTTPVTASTGKPGKAKYTLADGVADRTKAASAELLDANPLYPGLQLTHPLRDDRRLRKELLPTEFRRQEFFSCARSDYRSSAVATAATPSPRPVKPRPSVVVADTLTGAPMASET